MDPLCLLDKIDTEIDFREENHLIIVLKILVGDFMDPLYEDQSKVTPKSTNETEQLDAEYIYRDLFLWSILTHRLPMGKIFLGQMKTRICSALLASKVLKSLSNYAPDHESKKILLSEADDFETHAIEFVRCSYSYNKQLTCELIMRQVKLYGDVTCLQMAIVADDKKFLDEDACSALLTNIWYDKVDPVQEQTLLVVNMLTMGISQFFISIHEKYFRKTPTTKQGSHVS